MPSDELTDATTDQHISAENYKTVEFCSTSPSVEYNLAEIELNNRS